MANAEHLERLKRSVDDWNSLREKQPRLHPDLRDADLSATNLSGADISQSDLTRANLSFSDLFRANLFRSILRNSNLRGAKVIHANLFEADLGAACLANAQLQGATLSMANLVRADLSNADLKEADLADAILTNADLRNAEMSGANLGSVILNGADLGGADLTAANLSGADLSGANLSGTNLSGANLRSAALTGANLQGATFINTLFADVNLSGTLGLEHALHAGPSSVGLDTLYKSEGRIPDGFLRDAGVPQDVIGHLLPLIRNGPPIQWHSCFISYSTKDEEFARRLHSRMRQAGMRVWFAPEDLAGGKKLHEQLFEAIQVQDKLLLVLSAHSIQSEWVTTEIRKAREVEKKEKRRKLFPIRLVDFAELNAWTCFDADSGKDLAVEVREYFIPDFSKWKDHDSFEESFLRLQKDLKNPSASAVPPTA